MTSVTGPFPPKLTEEGRRCLAALRRVSRRERKAAAEVDDLIAAARDLGASWPQIGEAMGTAHVTPMRRYKRKRA